MIKAVLFDMDGILYDSEYYYLLGTIDQLRSYGYTGSDEAVYKTIGLDMESNFRYLAELLDHKVDEDTVRVNNDRYFNELHPIDYKAIMFEGVDEQLRIIRSMGITTAVCSASPMYVIRNSLRDMGIEDCFDYIQTAENVSRPKPAPDIYLEAQKALGVEKECCIVYEDSAPGIEAGRQAGIFTVAREEKRFNIDQSHADKIVKDIFELTEWIREENANA